MSIDHEAAGKLPVCACGEFYEQHHPECPALLAYLDAMARMKEHESGIFVRIGRFNVQIPEADAEGIIAALREQHDRLKAYEDAPVVGWVADAPHATLYTDHVDKAERWRDQNGYRITPLIAKPNREPT